MGRLSLDHLTCWPCLKPKALPPAKMVVTAGVAGRLGAAKEDCGMVEQGAVGCPDFLELVHEAGHAGQSISSR